jgi:flavin reductase (DIM6/NTAB) family NADH-FMN oxidoreductase RutF
VDLAAVNSLIAALDRELWLVTAQANDQHSGLIATFVNPASIVPELPRFLVGLAKTHRTQELVEASGAFALHLLAPHNLDWVWRFGTTSGRSIDKFAGLDVRTAMTGSPLLTGAIGWLDCRVEERMDTGDRVVYLGAVVEACVTKAIPPLTMKQAVQLSPPDRLAELKRQLQHDSRADADAIRAWRQRRGGTGTP